MLEFLTAGDAPIGFLILGIGLSMALALNAAATIVRGRMGVSLMRLIPAAAFCFLHTHYAANIRIAVVDNVMRLRFVLARHDYSDEVQRIHQPIGRRTWILSNYGLTQYTVVYDRDDNVSDIVAAMTDAKHCIAHQRALGQHYFLIGISCV